MRKLRQKFILILILAVMFTMAQTAWAATVKETRTTTWQMDGGASGSTTLENSLTLLNAEGKRLYTIIQFKTVTTVSPCQRCSVIILPVLEETFLIITANCDSPTLKELLPRWN